MNKKFSKLLGLLLALALVFTAIPVSFADPAASSGNAETTDPAAPAIDVKFDLTVNKLRFFDWTKLSVVKNCSYRWEATTEKDPKSTKLVSEKQHALTSDMVAVPTTEKMHPVSDKANIKDYKLHEVYNVKLVVTLDATSAIADPALKVSVGDRELKDEKDNSILEQAFDVTFNKDGSFKEVAGKALETGKKNFEVTVAKDFTLEYAEPALDDLTLTLLDSKGKGVEGKEIKAFAVKTNGTKYVTDQNGDFIVEENANSVSLGFNNMDAGNGSSLSTNGKGVYRISKAKLQPILDQIAVTGYPGNSNENKLTVAFAAVENGKVISDYAFVTIKSGYQKNEVKNLTGVMHLNKSFSETTFKVLVREINGDVPVQAGKGYKVTLMKNEAKHLEEPKWVASKYEAVTNENGEVELKVPNSELFTDHEIMDALTGNRTGENARPGLLPKDFLAYVRKYSVASALKVTSPDGKQSQIKNFKSLKLKDEDTKLVFDFDISKPYKFNRIAGENRFETAVQIAKRTFPEGLKSGVAILAESENGADALAAAGLSHVLQAPVLLTGRGSSTLNKATADYMKEQVKAGKLKYVVVLGGTDAIPGAIESYINNDKDLKLDVSRMYGENRYETARQIAEFMRGTGNVWKSISAAMKKSGVDIDNDLRTQSFTQVILANGTRFADGVIASVPAAKFGTPVLLTEANSLHKEAKEFIEETAAAQGTFRTYLMGGTAVLSDNVYGQIKGSKTRLDGENRYWTNIKTNKEFFARATKLYIATGTALPDSLVSGMLVANDDAALMLVGPNGLTDAQKKYLKESTSYSSVEILGGFNAVPATVEDQIMEFMANRVK